MMRIANTPTVRLARYKVGTFTQALYDEARAKGWNVIRNLSKLGVMGQSSGQTESGVDPVWWTVAEWGK